MEEIFKNPIFGISITLVCFYIGNLVYGKLKYTLFQPFIICVFIIISLLIIFKIPTKYYNEGGSIIQMMLAPATCAIAISMYKQIKTIKKNFLPIVIGTFVGALSSIISIYLLCKIFKIEDNIYNAMLPKSVTNAIAIGLSEKRGGIVAVTIACVVLTGIFGAVFSPMLIKIFKLKNPISIGLAIGTSSHGIGTAKALEIGETEGALSGIAMGLTGIMTVLIMLFI